MATAAHAPRCVEEILDALAARGSVATRCGQGWQARCPAHDDKTPSLSVSPGPGGAALIYCHAGCPTTSVLAALFPGDRLVPASLSPGFTSKGTRPEEPQGPSGADYAALASWLDECAKRLGSGSEGAKEALSYAQRRFGLGADDCAALGLGLDRGDRDEERPGFATGMAGPARLVVPFLDAEGTARGAQGRALIPGAKVRWAGLKGTGWAGLGYFGLQRAGTVIVCEGPGDALAAYGAGYPAVLIAGASRARKAVAILAPALNARQVVVAGDNDEPGQLFAEAVAGGLGARKVQLPSGINDLTAWREDNPVGFDQRLGKAIKASEPATPRLRVLPTAPEERIILGGQLDDLTARAVNALERANEPPHLFVRAGRIVRCRDDENGRPVIDDATPDIVRCHLAEATEWIQVRADGKLAPAHPPLALAKNVIAKGEWPLPPLVGIVEAPTIRPNGTVATDPGYDRVTRLIYRPAPGLTLPHIPDHPSDGDVHAAVSLIDELLVDFPFDSEASRAAAWALLLTPIVRPAISQPVPLALLDAPQRGTGKSLLTELVAIVTTGRPAAMMPPAEGRHSEDEWRKRITSTLMTASALVVIDNVEGTLSSSALSAVLSSTTFSDRILGRSEQIELPVRCTWCATGNNLTVSADLVRRCYRVRLDAKVDQPWLRTRFRHDDLRTWAEGRRGDILAALLTLARAWWTAGCPTPSNIPRLGGYREWTEIVGGVLSIARVSDFLADLGRTYSQIDEETAEWGAFLAAWSDRYRTDSITLASFETAMGDNDRSLVETVPGSLARHLGSPTLKKALGEALRARVDRRYGPRQLRIERAGQTRNGVALWRVAEG